MVDRKFYKTRLCALYQRGRCSHQHCNFAHSEAELRRSFNGKQEYHCRDLRENLGRKFFPLHKFSPGRDIGARHSSHGNSSPRKMIDRDHRKRHKMDDLRDHSGSSRMADGVEDHTRERKHSPSVSRVLLDDQLRQVRTEAIMLENDKRQLEVFLAEKVQEFDSLASKVHELEVQLSKEKEEVKRITSRIKKFIKAHNRHLRLQEELKRSYNQVQKLGEQLDLDSVRPGTNEEDSEMNSRLNTIKGAKSEVGKTRLEKLTHKTGHSKQFHSGRKPDVIGDVNIGRGSLPYKDIPKRGRYQTDNVSAEKKISWARYLNQAMCHHQLVWQLMQLMKMLKLMKIFRL